ncbi:MAG: bifunctional UDP-N-acetylmuramoyl-tripeptide:D-alanyl-D-alanine ligase/alanine racemase [Lewinellaceae bacterium]|nr:bifunctional UDP-N-acetylmuramoyl-tripeptide:D-alanyl-D-alanine ligase/alanine racemase [Lewinellaceae bacterium]
MRYTAAHIQQILRAEPLNEPLQEHSIEYLLHDSRQILFPGQSLFFALAGPRQDGHRFIREAYAAGVRNFVVSKPVDTRRYPEANFLKVDNTLEALQLLAAYHRKQFDLPVIGITGSNGKTIVKEWLYQLLQDDYHIVRSPKSYNSQIGVPLSVWQIQPAHELAIFEAGISQVGEMEHLASIIRPTIGILTNIGDAHNEGFPSLENKLREKLLLFGSATSIIYRRDNPLVDKVIREMYADRRLFSWSTSGREADLRILKKQQQRTGMRLEGVCGDTPFVAEIPFTDEAALENGLHCLALLVLLGYPVQEAAQGLGNLEQVAMRLELKAGINNCTVINDAYNSDLTSLAIALYFLRQQSNHAHRTLILSDILQSGEPGPALYQKVAELVAKQGVTSFIGIGVEVPHIRPFLPDDIPATFYADTGQFLRKFDQHGFRNQTILLKGARSFHFEQIANRLSYKAHKTTLEIDLDALRHNLRYFQRKLRPGVKLLVMVKAAGYGSGAEEVARLLEFQQVDYLGVAYADEGVELRKAGIRLPILVLNPEEAGFDALFRYRLEPEIYSVPLLRRFLEALPEDAPEVAIHLKLETGMNRLGLSPAELPEVLRRLQSTPGVRVASVLSHLAASEDPLEDAYTRQQAALFAEGYALLAEGLGYRPVRHLLNSSGIIRFPQYQMDMVRLGIGLYGVENAPELKRQLQTVLTLKATISQVREVPAGQTIGYNRLGKADTPKRIATISIGYADGLLRLAGNGRFEVLIRGRRAPTIGNVCMDMTMVDVSQIPEATEGDEVVLFGKDLPIEELARALNTIPYEVLTNLSERLKRVYWQD